MFLHNDAICVKISKDTNRICNKLRLDKKSYGKQASLGAIIVNLSSLHLPIMLIAIGPNLYPFQSF